ncbi:MAG: sigma-70 family RNA polymerase sigma factor [Deltaproteobacteria bacterium]|nr:sigma-70 family RNA polymerase sigma factor [Deltaproteobacteria bacterium]
MAKTSSSMSKKSREPGKTLTGPANTTSNAASHLASKSVTGKRSGEASAGSEPAVLGMAAPTAGRKGELASSRGKTRRRRKDDLVSAPVDVEAAVPAEALDEDAMLMDVAPGGEAEPVEDFGLEPALEGPLGDLPEAELQLADVEEAPVKANKDDEAQSFLAMYFKNMADLDVLRPEQEFDSAREIEALEIELWTMLLSYLPGAMHVASVVERTMGKAYEPLEQYKVAFAKLGGKAKPAARKQFDGVVDEVSSKLREVDIDRLFVDAVMAEIHKARRGVTGDGAPGFEATSPAFNEFANAAVAKTVAIKSAKNAFVRANLRLVVSIARRFNHGRLPLADLIQEGNIGLMKAVERYDYRRGFRFSTYASWWIRHAISRALADKGRAVRLPVHMIDAYHRIAKSERELQSKLERPATNEELSAATGIEPDKLEKMRGFLNESPVSLDRPISDEDGRKLIDILVSDEDEVTAPEQIIVGETHREMLKVLGSLKPIEADILRKRFGLMNDKEQTLKEIGDEYHLSRERVRQLQEQALGKMRKAMQKINAA